MLLQTLSTIFAINICFPNFYTLHHPIRTPLQRAIGIGREGAILENEVVAVAQWLCAGDTTTNKTKVESIPAEVLAFDVRVIDRDVLAIPEGIFRIQHSVADLYTAGVLERVLALQLEIGDLELLRMQKSILGIMHLDVHQFSASAMPKGLDSIGDFRAFDEDIFELSKDLRRIYLTVLESQIPAVPHRGSVRRGKDTFFALHLLALPKRVFAFETAIHSRHASRLLESRLPLADSDAVEFDITALIQRPLAIEIFIRD